MSDPAQYETESIAAMHSLAAECGHSGGQATVSQVHDLRSPGHSGRRWSRLSIRWRLTLWYAGSLCLMLAGFGFLVWMLIQVWLVRQSDAELVEELAELLESVETSVGRESLQRNVGDWAQLHEPYGFEFEIESDSGRLLLRSQRLARLNATLASADSSGGDTVETCGIPGLGSFRVRSVRTTAYGEPLLIRIGLMQDEQQQLLHELAVALLSAGVIVMAGAAGGGYLLSRRVLQPVEEITRTAARISASQLDERIAVDNPHDELGRLAQTLNTMLDRLDRSFAELKRFTADAAHELRTPLAVLRNELEVCLRTPRETDDYRQTLRSALDDTERMGRLAGQLLELARGDASTEPVPNDPVPVAALLIDVVAQLDSQAQTKQITVQIDAGPAVTGGGEVSESLPGGVAVSGDCGQLRRLFVNLVDNSIKYTPPGGRVTVRTEIDDNVAAISIEDSGNGIPAEHLPRIFDRFYRIDASRASSTGGTGLGLAICRSIVDAHRGTIDVTSQIGQGTLVRVRLPIFSHQLLPHAMDVVATVSERPF
ncbi:HAMP domain-containing protein [bacterium]|nr:HAMP domain-containing protein [bacterium]